MQSHIKRVRLIIGADSEKPKQYYRIRVHTTCGEAITATLRGRAIPYPYLADVVTLALATKLEKRISKHLKGCKICRIAKKKMKALRSTTARA